MPKITFRLVFFVGSFILTLAVASLFFTLKNQNSKASVPSTLFEKRGFDFRLLRSSDKTLSEPKTGSKIDLSNLRMSDGRKLADLENEKLFLFAVVDPECPACASSGDVFRNIRKTTSDLGIKYFPVVFTKTPPNFDSQKYAESMGFEISVQWLPESVAPESLSTIPTPTHLLTNKDGVVLQIWLGTNKNEDVRKRMSDQISSDLILITDIIDAINSNSNKSK
jgi:hypothetical protein